MIRLIDKENIKILDKKYNKENSSGIPTFNKLPVAMSDFYDFEIGTVDGFIVDENDNEIQLTGDWFIERKISGKYQFITKNIVIQNFYENCKYFIRVKKNNSIIFESDKFLLKKGCDNWILATGEWSDLGIWCDKAIWID